jgi:hypothetical protein
LGLEEVLELNKRNYGENHIETGKTLAYLSSNYRSLKNYDKA